MKELRLRNGGIALIDDEDWPIASALSWSVTANGRYARTRTGPRQRAVVLLHRLLLGAARGQEVDHINGDGLDNRRSNLRLCSHKENCRNRRPVRDGLKGVWLQRTAIKRPWVAQIRADGRKRVLGHFATQEEAARAYDRAAREIHGAFARPNFTEGA